MIAEEVVSDFHIKVDHIFILSFLRQWASFVLLPCYFNYHTLEITIFIVDQKVMSFLFNRISTQTLSTAARTLLC